MKFKLLPILFVFLVFSIGFSQEKTIQTIEISGAKKTSVKYLKRILKSKPTAVLDSIVLLNDINQLKKLAAIAHATFKVEKTIDKNNFDVIFTVEENFTIIPDINFWTNNRSDIAYKIGIYDHNFLGKNIGFGGFYQNNGYNTYAVNFKAPHLFSPKFGLALNHQNWKSEEPLYFNEGVANYLYNNISYEVLGLYELNSKNNFEFGINSFKENYNYLNGITSNEIPQKLSLKKLLFKFVYNYSNLKYHYQFLDGFKSQFYGQIVKSKGLEKDFLIAWNDFFYFKRIGERGNWANRIRMGLATNNDSPFAPFSLDNNVNLRGVGIIVDRGTGSIVLNSEYRYALLEKNWFCLQGNAFIDAGSWRNPGGELSDFTNHKNIRVFSGIGLRFIHKKIYNAVLRIDYGHSLMGDGTNGIVFGVGQYF